LKNVTSPSNQLQTELKSKIDSLDLKWQIQVLDTIDSTSSELIRQVKSGLQEPKILLAMKQTQGRGRRGNTWFSSPNDSLTLSLGFLLEPKNWLGLSLCVGIDLIQSMDPQQRLDLQLKWPNDVWVKRNGQYRKLAGILIETLTTNLPHKDSARYCVVGIGVNLQTPAFEMDAHAIPPLGLFELEPERSANEIILDLARRLPKTLHCFELEGFSPFKPKFEALNALQGLDLFLSDGTRGICHGVNDQGELMLLQDGRLQAHNNLELSVRPFGTTKT
jgi:BirA family biotin operon repressor/biotin-[acetyl-CoA-carboxylase] ligase